MSTDQDPPGTGQPTLAAIALGSNLGDRAAQLDAAVARLGSVLSDLRVSRYHETAPVDVPGRQRPFLNAAAVGSTTLSARALLDRLLAIEHAQGRARPYRHAPRTLDLDLILFGDAVVSEPGLIVPHPEFRTRRFVLEPLAEIGANLIDPVTSLSVGDLLARVRSY